MTSEADVEALVEQFRSPDADARVAAYKELRSLSGTLTPDAVVALVAAAGETYPTVEQRLGIYPPTPNAELLEELWAVGEQVPLARVEPLLALPDDDVRAAALRLLAEIPGRPAALRLAREVEAIADEEVEEDDDEDDESWLRPLGQALWRLERSPRDGDVLVPALVGLLRGLESYDQVGRALISYAGAGEIGPDAAGVAADAIVPWVSRALPALAADVAEHGPRLRYDIEHEHRDQRTVAGVMLDLLGRLPAVDVGAVLGQAAAHPDPWLALWGVVGQLRQGGTPDAAGVARVAADPEARLVLHDTLAALGRLDVMPPSERTQAKLAEAVMVSWLMDPGELGEPPDHVEQVAVASMTVEDEPGDLYVFRFRLDGVGPAGGEPGGWMVGVAGPFLPREEPTSEALGATFSQLEPYDAGRLREQVESIVGTLATWSEAHQP
jgi:hypothetical protein